MGRGATCVSMSSRSSRRGCPVSSTSLFSTGTLFLCEADGMYCILPRHLPLLSKCYSWLLPTAGTRPILTLFHQQSASIQASCYRETCLLGFLSLGYYLSPWSLSLSLCLATFQICWSQPRDEHHAWHIVMPAQGFASKTNIYIYIYSHRLKHQTQPNPSPLRSSVPSPTSPTVMGSTSGTNIVKQMKTAIWLSR